MDDQVKSLRQTRRGVTKVTAVSIPLDLYEAIEQAAEANDRSVTGQIVHYLRAALTATER